MTIVKSRIDTVKVYHSGATIQRVVRLENLDGDLPREVEIRDLPLALLDHTVRVRVEGVPAGCEAAATDVRVGICVESPKEVALADEREQLKAVGRKILKGALLLKQIQLESNYLRAMDVPERPEGDEGKPPPASPMAARVALEQFIDDAVQQRIDESRTLRRELKELREEEARLRALIQRASSAKDANPDQLRKMVVARLVGSGDAVQSATLLVEYVIPGARWTPAYQCRLTRDCRRAEMHLRAMVCQRSGEDWRGVKLILSTASPLSWTELPKLSSIRIGKAQPPPRDKIGLRPPPTGNAALYADYDRDRTWTSRLIPAAPRKEAPTLSSLPPGMVPDPGQIAGDLDDVNMYVATGAADELFEEDLDSAGEGLQRVSTNVDQAEMAPAARAAPPPAPQPAMPAGFAAAAPPKLSKRAARAAPPVRSRDKAMDGEMELPPEEDMEAALAVVFSQLRLGAPDDSHRRNQLRALDLQRSYRELLPRSAVDVNLDLNQVVSAAQRAAAEVSYLPLPGGTTDVRHSSGFFDFNYQADALVDLESDGAFHSIALGNRDADSDVRYVVVPREDLGAFRTATLTNALAAPLLPGPVEVHVGGEYVLTTALPLVAKNGTFQLGLGVEQAIKVSRSTRFEERRSGEKVVAMSELEHQVEIELVNHLDRKVDCEVRERLPAPAEGAEVVVEEVAVEPTWEAYDQRERNAEIQGGRRWQVEIGPGAAAKLKAAYVVKIYANNELVGGNRREV